MITPHQVKVLQDIDFPKDMEYTRRFARFGAQTIIIDVITGSILISTFGSMAYRLKDTWESIEIDADKAKELIARYQKIRNFE